MSNRRLRRFFTRDAIREPQEHVLLSRADTEHLSRILRLKPGDRCLVTDGAGQEAEAVIADIKSPQARLRIEKLLPRAVSGEPLFVYPAFIQRGKMDELVRQMQELGIRGLFPLETERTVVKMREDAKDKVLERWEKVIQEAAKQSGSLEKMQCDIPRGLEEVLERIPEKDRRVVFHPGPDGIPFKEWVRRADTASRTHLFLGPEGGFSEKEVSLLKSKGAVQVSLGETILKADTAVLAAAGAVRFLCS